jgi:N-acetylneuraminate synthase
MLDMANAFPNKVYGLSDHTTSNLACLAAIALGASIVERHFTDRMDREGPDIICSMDEKNTKMLIRDSKLLYLMRGGKKEALKEERVTIDFAYASIVTIRPIFCGEILTKDNIWVKRPGIGGIPADKFNSLLGKRALVDISNNIQLKWEMIQ